MRLFRRPAEYVWVITVRWPGPEGAERLRTRSGSIRPERGEGRGSLVTRAVAAARQSAGAPADAPVVCLYLEPNTL